LGGCVLQLSDINLAVIKYLHRRHR
jgi:hypothetical protein